MNVYSGVWKPSTIEKAKKLAGSVEVTNLSLKSGGAAAFVSFYNGLTDADAIPANLIWVLDASTQDADSDTFEDGLIFSKGVYAVCEQGWDFNPVVCIAVRKYVV